MIVDFRGKNIYVEVYGEGPPIVLLNGIMMSTKSWAPFSGPLSKNNKLILLDFLDQGESSKMTEDYPVTIQADVVKHVLDALKISKAHIAGVSYGAAVAMHFALMYPETVDRLALFNCIPYTSPWLTNIGEGWKAARITAEAYYYMTIPTIYSMGFYNTRTDWFDSRKDFLLENVFSSSVFLDAMERLSNSMSTHDVRDRLFSIGAKTLVVGGSDDYLTPLSEQRYIVERIPNADMVIMENCGHAGMYEKPTIFATLLTGFVNHDIVAI